LKVKEFIEDILVVKKVETGPVVVARQHNKVAHSPCDAVARRPMIFLSWLATSYCQNIPSVIRVNRFYC